MANWLVLYIFSEPRLPSGEMGYRHAVIEEDDTLASDIPSTTVGPRCQAAGIIYLYLYSIAYICLFAEISSRHPQTLLSLSKE